MFKQHIAKEQKREKYYIGKIIYYNKKVELSTYVMKHSEISRNEYYLLLQKIYATSGYNWYLITNQFPHEDYVWWSYTNYSQNRRLRLYIDELEMYYKTDLGCPHNIISIIEIINVNTYFNRRIRYFFTLMSWAHNIFIYYNRFYRYLHNDKLFGKKQRIPMKHRHKLHFIPYMYHRQITGVKLSKNNLRL